MKDALVHLEGALAVGGLAVHMDLVVRTGSGGEEEPRVPHPPRLRGQTLEGPAGGKLEGRSRSPGGQRGPALEGHRGRGELGSPRWARGLPGPG